MSWADFSAEWKDSTGRTLPGFNLPKRECIILKMTQNCVIFFELGGRGLPNFGGTPLDEVSLKFKGKYRNPQNGKVLNPASGIIEITLPAHGVAN